MTTYVYIYIHRNKYTCIHKYIFIKLLLKPKDTIIFLNEKVLKKFHIKAAVRKALLTQLYI